MELSRRTFVKLCAAAAGAAGFGVRRAGTAAAQGGGGVILPKPDRPGKVMFPFFEHRDKNFQPLRV